MKREIVKLTELYFKDGKYTGIGEISLDIVKCLTICQVRIEQSDIPKPLMKFVNKDIKSLRQKPLYVLCDATNLKYSFSGFTDHGEEYYLPTDVSGTTQILEIYKGK